MNRDREKEKQARKFGLVWRHKLADTHAIHFTCRLVAYEILKQTQVRFPQYRYFPSSYTAYELRKKKDPRQFKSAQFDCTGENVKSTQGQSYSYSFLGVKTEPLK